MTSRGDAVALGQVGFAEGDSAVEQRRFVVPSGTVTFLLTDIEGSSRRWDADPEAMASGVARHYEILDEAVARWGGVGPLEQGEGDSIVAAFPRASDATAAAVEAQSVLVAELGASFSVRMALHTGEAPLRDEANYFGDAVNRCARVRACGHGGQILCTQTVVDLLADRLPDGASLVDLGRHRLHDLGRAEQIWQLTPTGHPAMFPPLRSLDAFRHSLPVALTSFVGRSAELVELRQLVGAASCRLLTLVGGGGCGKTRLALRLAGELVDQFDGGVWWVELASIGEAGRVADAVLDAVGLRQQPARRSLETASSWLAGTTTLVVLDNCEHLIEEAAEVSGELLQRCPQLKIVATSREPLGVDGETMWRVPSLATPETGAGPPVELSALGQLESVRLFLDRAHGARPNFVLTEDNAPAIAQICARLDGIPLAIELAAARCRTLTPQRIAAGLDDRFRILTGGSRTVTPRQQTLLASIDWSHQLLDEVERAVFRRLSVFSGSFTLDAAETVCADPDLVDELNVLDLVTRLVDKSLLIEAHTAAGSVRFRMLETVRQYALGQCQAENELEATRDRHLDHYLSLAGRLDWDPAAPDVVDQEYADILAALNWSTGSPEKALRFVSALAFTWGLLDRYADIRQLGRTVLDLGKLEHPQLWARAVAFMADALLFAGDKSFLDLLDEADRIAAAAEDRAALARSSFARAFLGTPTEMIARRDLGADHGRAAGDPYGALNGIVAALARIRVGDLDHHWEQQLADDLKASEQTAFARTGRAQAATFLSWAPLLRGDLVQAGKIIDKAAAELTSRMEEATRALVVVPMTYLALLQQDQAILHAANQIRDAFGSEWLSYGQSMLSVARQAEALFWGANVPDDQLIAQLTLNGWQDDLSVGLSLIRDLPGPPLDLCRPALNGPYSICRAALHQGWFEVANGDPEGIADTRVHAALADAFEHGFRPTVVDCLETLAALTEDKTASSRLLGATRQLRADMTYRFRWPHLQRLLAPRLEDLDLDAMAVGAGLGYEGIIELVRRMRGERRRPARGWGSLTTTELAVVELVAAGRTNPQIAAKLLMSRSTVKTHLGHIFAKLNVTTRSELAATATRRGTTI